MKREYRKRERCVCVYVGQEWSLRAAMEKKQESGHGRPSVNVRPHTSYRAPHSWMIPYLQWKYHAASTSRGQRSALGAFFFFLASLPPYIHAFPNTNPNPSFPISPLLSPKYYDKFIRNIFLIIAFYWRRIRHILQFYLIKQLRLT